MKATSLLEQQHRQVEGIFEQLGELEKPDSAAKKLVEELADSLAAHMAIEHELFYPAVRKVDEELIAESFEEHAIAETALKRLLAAGSSSTFKARVTALKELIEHHVKEEENELFPKVEKALEDEQNEQLGQRMEARFDKVAELGYQKLVPKGAPPRTSADRPVKKTPARRKPARKSAPPARRRSAA